MPAFTASAPGKIILFGEHAVVYGQPAIAVPVSQVRARAVVIANITRALAGGERPSSPQPGLSAVIVDAPEVSLHSSLADLPAGHPLARAIVSVFETLKVSQPPSCTVRIRSTIPLAAGMGSGAAVSVAVIRALSAFLGHPLPLEQVSALAFEVEKIHHGTPSGIDNSVVTFAKPVYYLRGQPIQILKLPAAFHIVIGNTGVSSPTAAVVGDVRRGWQTDPPAYESLFSAIGDIARQARKLIESGSPHSLGPLMDQNHALLSQLGVSSPQLDALVKAARQSGALGAKLSGGGRGGAMIALVDEKMAAPVAQALLEQGAVTVIRTTVGGKNRRTNV